jgi:uncharacterized membrane protein YkvI
MSWGQSQRQARRIHLPVAEVFLVLAVFALPILAGAAARLLGKPWWWGAIVAIVIMLVAAIAPEPEEGESRLVAGDLVFLFVVALIVAGLAWLGARLAGRFVRSA